MHHTSFTVNINTFLKNVQWLQTSQVSECHLSLTDSYYNINIFGVTFTYSYKNNIAEWKT